MDDSIIVIIITDNRHDDQQSDNTGGPSPKASPRRGPSAAGGTGREERCPFVCESGRQGLPRADEGRGLGLVPLSRGRLKEETEGTSPHQ